MKCIFKIVFTLLLFYYNLTLFACSGTGEISLCNIIHSQDFVSNGFVWIGEPTNNCSTYTSYAGNFEACQFLVKEILHGAINKSDSSFTNTDSLVWVIGGPSNLCYENANFTSGEYLFATRFQNHYAYDTTFKGYSTYAFNADRFLLNDTIIGNFINDISYFYPEFNLGPDTIYRNQLQNLVDNCISDIFVNEQEISIYQKSNSNTFNILGDLTSYKMYMYKGF